MADDGSLCWIAIDLKGAYRRCSRWYVPLRRHDMDDTDD